MFATVTDSDDRLVPGLTRDRFEVRDNGRPQPVTLFDNTPQPIRLIVMIDISGSMLGNPEPGPRGRSGPLRPARTW